MRDKFDRILQEKVGQKRSKNVIETSMRNGKTGERGYGLSMGAAKQ